MPSELEEALFVVGLCERFRCLPDQLATQSMDLVRMVELVAMVRAAEGA